MSDRAAINEAIGKSFELLASGRPVTIPVDVADPDGALVEVERIGLDGVVADGRLLILANGARPPQTEALPAPPPPARPLAPAPVNTRTEALPADEACRRAQGLPLLPEEIRPAPPWRPELPVPPSYRAAQPIAGCQDTPKPVAAATRTHSGGSWANMRRAVSH